MGYSIKELRLIEKFGYYKLAYEDNGIPPPAIYKMMMEKAFMEDMQGDHVESLRRCVRAMWLHNMYRSTPEFEALITV